MARKCRNKSNTPTQAQAHLTSTSTFEELSYITMITVINMVGGYEGWWMDTGASLHVCFGRAMFKTYTAAKD